MDYWAETMQDDCYLIAADGWKAETYRIIEKDKKGKEKDKGWACDLVPKPLIVARYFAKEQAAIDQLAAELESVTARLAELEEEHGGEEGAFAELDKVNKANVAARLKEIKGDKEAKDEAAVLNEWLKLNDEEADLKKRLKDAEAALDAKAYAQYPKLTEAEIKTLVVDDKWLAALDAAIHGEMDRISQQLTQRVKELAERYETPLPQMVEPRGRAGGEGEPPPGKDGVRMEVKPGYKQTEVGVIPEDWEVATDRAMSSIQLGKMLDADEATSGMPKPDSCVMEPSMEAAFDLTDIRRRQVTPSRSANVTRLEHGDSCLRRRRHWSCGSSGISRWTSALIRRHCIDVEPIHGYNVALIAQYTSLLDLLASATNLRYANEHRDHLPIRRSSSQTIPIPLPPTKAEQEAIAEALSDADALIESLEQLLAKKRQLKQGAMQELLTGKKRLPGFSGEWEMKRLGEVVNF